MKQNKLLNAFLAIILGVLLIIYKQSIIQIAITVFGAFLIALGIFDILKKRNLAVAIVKLSIGVVVIVLAWVLTNIAIYILGGLIVLTGIINLLESLKLKNRTILSWALPLITILAGLFIIFGDGIDILFIIAGIIVLSKGIAYLVQILDK